jgi:hypothetical protein
MTSPTLTLTSAISTLVTPSDTSGSRNSIEAAGLLLPRELAVQRAFGAAAVQVRRRPQGLAFEQPRRGCRGRFGLDQQNWRSDGHGLAGLHEDFGDASGVWAGDISGSLVCFDFADDTRQPE